jgi:hypothetical protein
VLGVNLADLEGHDDVLARNGDVVRLDVHSGR